MIYVTSDLHGCPISEFKRLLKSADFSDEDFLFILGDVIDRGKHGAELLCWISEQPNVQLILGNHEAMMLACSFIFDEITDENLSGLDAEKMDILSNWISNGAMPTVTGLRSLLKSEPDILEGVLELLNDAPLYDIAEAGGKRFVLVHSGLENFSADKKLRQYSQDELLWARPTLDTEYFTDGTIVVFGHTPTEMFGEQFAGRMIRAKSWICIDTGAANGNKPMLLRLDDLKEFY